MFARLTLKDELRRIALVTQAVSSGIRELLHAAAWEVREVPEVPCNQVLGPHVTPDKYDLGPEYQQKRLKWRSTCTKFHAWKLTFLKKAIFLDADTLVLRPIDSLVDHPSSFAAAPDTFPADQFNSGVMVIEPDERRLASALQLLSTDDIGLTSLTAAHELARDGRRAGPRAGRAGTCPCRRSGAPS